MSRFDIELTGFSGEPPVEELARTFGIDLSTARALVGGLPRTVKRGVDEAEAERFFHALRELGAEVKLHRAAPPSRPPPASPPAPPPSSAPPSSPPAPAFAASDLPVPDLEGPPQPAVGVHSSAPPPAGAAAAAGSIPASAGVPGGSEPPAPRAERQPIGEDRGGFVGNLLRAYVYPFQKALIPVALGVGFVSQLVSYVPALGGLFSTGIWISYVFAVIRHAALGRDDLPGGGEFEGFTDMIVPAVRFLLAILVPGMLLGGLYVALSAGGASAESLLTGRATFSLASAPLLFLVAFGLWLLYLPASLILAAHSRGCLGGLNLVGGVMLMVREPASYGLTIAAAAPAAAMMVTAAVITSLVDEAVLIPFVPGMLGTAVTIVPAIVVGRALGLFIWHHEHELGLG